MKKCSERIVLRRSSGMSLKRPAAGGVSPKGDSYKMALHHWLKELVQSGFVNLLMACANAAITNHSIMLFRNMSDEMFYEFHNRNGFLHILRDAHSALRKYDP